MRFWHKLTRFWLVWVVPAMVVFYSLLWSLPDPQTYQKAFAATNFYYEIARIAQKNPVSAENTGNFSLQTLAIVTVFGNFSQSQWQDLVEGNILAWTDWLSGRSSNLAVYIPVDQLELVLANNLDRTIQTIVRENKIPECSTIDLQNLKQANLAGLKFCLPPEVNTNQASFLDFLALDVGRIAPNLLAEDSFSLSRSRYFLTDLDNLSTPLLTSLTQQLNQVRDWLLVIKSKVWWFIGLTLIILLLHLLLTMATSRDLWLELAWLLGLIGSKLLALIVGLMLILGVGVFWFFQIFRVWLDQSVLADLIALFLKTSLYLGFYLNWWAVWVMCIVGFGFFLVRFVYQRKREQLWRKNQQLLEYQPDYQQANTFDSQFRQTLTKFNPNLAEAAEVTPEAAGYTTVNSENQADTVSKTFVGNTNVSENSDKPKLPAVKLKVKSKIQVIDVTTVPPVTTSTTKNLTDSNSDELRTNRNSKKIHL